MRAPPLVPCWPPGLSCLMAAAKSFGSPSSPWAGIVVLTQVGHWYRMNLARPKAPAKSHGRCRPRPPAQSRPRPGHPGCAGFSKYIYLTSMTSYYTFYLIQKFHLSIQSSQYFLSSSSSPSPPAPSSAVRWGIASAASTSSGRDPRRGALHPASPLCQFGGSRNPDRLYRRHPRLRFFRHRGLCAGSSCPAMSA